MLLISGFAFTNTTHSSHLVLRAAPSRHAVPNRLRPKIQKRLDEAESVWKLQTFTWIS